MNVQYISDSKGQTTGVFIPINEWNNLKKKYIDIQEEDIDIPEWHKDVVKERLYEYKKNPGFAVDFDSFIDDIEKEF